MKLKPTPMCVARGFCLFVAIAMLVVSSLVLTHGWMLGHEATIRLVPEFRAMVPSTALCFALLGIAFLQLFLPRGRVVTSSVAWITGVVVTICVANLATVYVVGGSGIDWVFRASRFGTDRMAIMTSVGLIVCSACILAILTFRDRASDTMTFVALLGFSTSLSVVAGHAFDARSLYKMRLFDGVSLPSALLFALFFAAVALLQIQHDE